MMYIRVVKRTRKMLNYLYGMLQHNREIRRQTILERQEGCSQKPQLAFTKLSFIFFYRDAETDILQCYLRRSFSLKI